MNFRVALDEIDRLNAENAVQRAQIERLQALCRRTYRNGYRAGWAQARRPVAKAPRSGRPRLHELVT